MTFRWCMRSWKQMASGGQISYEDALASLTSMFPHIDRSVIEAVLEINRELHTNASAIAELVVTRRLGICLSRLLFNQIVSPYARGLFRWCNGAYRRTIAYSRHRLSNEVRINS